MGRTMSRQELLGWAQSQGRVWTYAAGQWNGRGMRLGDDEYGRRTLVLRLPGHRAIVWAFWTCRCVECDESRRETREWI